VFAEKEEPSSPLQAAGLSNGVKILFYNIVLPWGISLKPFLNQSAIFVGVVVGFLNVCTIRLVASA
jgi:hypothetical protein